MKKFLSLILVLTLIAVMLCSCGENMSDGEAGDKGNIQTDDIGDGGTDTDSIIKDKEDSKVKDEEKASVSDDLKDGVDSAGRAVKDGINAVENGFDDGVTDIDKDIGINMK